LIYEEKEQLEARLKAEKKFPFVIQKELEKTSWAKQLVGAFGQAL
jgi:hypothetical protein